MAGGRPNLVRADTIDLQDQDAPTAAEHHKHIEADSIAPHQAAQIQHVQEERKSEEETLADAWNMAGQHGNIQGGNGKAEGELEKKVDETNAEGQDGSDDEDEDDDMMDRMSSSPSIEDGAFLQLSPTVATSTPDEGHYGTPQHAEHDRAAFNQSPTPALDSSPFVEVPRHMPLCILSSTSQTVAVQQATVDDALSPSLHTPETSLLIPTAVLGRFYSATSQHHRLIGRYGTGLELDLLDDEEFGEGGPDDRMDAKELPEKIDQGDVGEEKLHDMVSVTARNAFAQQPADRTPHSGLHPFLALYKEETHARQETHLIVDDQLLNNRLSLIPYDGDQWESDSSEDWTEQDDKDDDADVFLNLDDRFIDSGWGGECLRDTEDIDFEFVYALHTFVATVEGQANATKGDTMVLLDDSNSYWWLVRVVKDSSIGYLPAEHIETPTERLARLNKHRNIDLSQTMLGDNPEKTRNPLKKAMRRRTAKTVQFAAPTYVEASDYDYSSEDEDGMIDPYGNLMESQHDQASERGQSAEVEERNAPEEANVHATRRFSGESFNNSKASLDGSSKASMDSKRSSIEDPQLSPKLVDRSEAAPLKSRKGTPRNADSFLKDEGMETRKMTLTPGLLRDDTMSKASSTESTRTESFERLVKTPSPQEDRSKRDSKDKKKDKKTEKKQGMLSGLFKSKKDKKKLAARDEGELSDMEKVSAEMSRGNSQTSPSTLSGNVSPVDRMASGLVSAGNITQARAKLQKSSPSDNSRVMSPVEEPQQQTQRQYYYQPPGGFVAELEGDNAAYEMATGQEHNMPAPQPEPEPPVQEKTSSLLPIANILRSGSTTGEPKPKKAKRSKQRVELDDFDEPEEEEQGPNPFLEQEQRSRQASQESDRLSASPVEIFAPGAGTFMHGTESIHIPQMNVDDSDEDEDEDDEDEEVSAKNNDSRSTSTDPSIVEKPSDQQQQQPLDRPSAQRGDTQALMSGMPGYMPPPTPAEEYPNLTTTAPREITEDNDLTPTITPQLQHSQPHQPTPIITTRTTSPPSTSSPTPETSPSQRHQTQPSISTSTTAPHQEWHDANLRAWFDADDVKDMLAIIHNTKADAQPQDHPAMKGLYDAERKGIDSMMGELDGMLGSLLRRRGVIFS